LSSTRAHGTVRCAVSALGLPGVRAPAPGPTAVAPAAGGPPASRSSSRTRGVRTRGRSTGMSCRLSGRSRWPLLTPTCSTRSMPSCGTAVTIATASGTCGSPDSVGARVQRAAGRIPAWGSRHRRSGRSHFILSGALRRAVRWLDLGESDRPGGPAGHAKVESWPPTPAQAARIIITARGWTGLGHVVVTTVSGLRRGELCSNRCSLRATPPAALDRRYGHRPTALGAAEPWPSHGLELPSPAAPRLARRSAQRINAQMASASPRSLADLTPESRSVSPPWPSLQRRT
jgi:hypothetical protein